MSGEKPGTEFDPNNLEGVVGTAQGLVVWRALQELSASDCIQLESAEFYQQLLGGGQWSLIICPHCGLQLHYSSFEVLGYFALSLLEKDIIIVRVDSVPSLW